MIIREALPEDVSRIIDLCEAHANYEKAIYQPENKTEQFSKYLFGDEKPLNCLVVEHNGKLVGYATFMMQFSTWDAEYYVYLDCLFLTESVRGQGLGRTLMQYIRDFALQQNCHAIQWQTPTFNHRAIEFYQRLGAISRTKERFIWQMQDGNLTD